MPLPDQDPIFDLITMPRSHGGGSGSDGDGAAAAVRYISNLLKMCHKLLYAKFGVWDSCRYHMKKLPVQLMRVNRQHL